MFELLPVVLVRLVRMPLAPVPVSRLFPAVRFGVPGVVELEAHWTQALMKRLVAHPARSEPAGSWMGLARIQVGLLQACSLLAVRVVKCLNSRPYLLVQRLI